MGLVDGKVALVAMPDRHPDGDALAQTVSTVQALTPGAP